MAMNQSGSMQLSRSEMTSVLENAWHNSGHMSNEGDIPMSEINIPGGGFGSGGDSFGGGGFGNSDTYPQVIPNSPTFTVPANPLLPDEYSEILDYNAIQYLNGIFRTQIGRFVRVQQLIGSNTTQDFDGFLIGVGINYIILQEYANKDIRILDIYGIKQMYVYYSEAVSPYTSPTI